MIRPTFAEWQRSRGIPSWEWVHAVRGLRLGLERQQRAIVEAFTPVLRQAARNFEALAKALQS